MDAEVHNILSGQIGLKNPMGHLGFQSSTLHLKWSHLKAFIVLLMELAALWEELLLHGCKSNCLVRSQPAI